MSSFVVKLMTRCYLVGAGIGDLELITLKAKRLIETADVILYDYLIPQEILDWTHADCELIYTGKHLDDKYVSQDKINQILIKKCLQYSSSQETRDAKEFRERIVVRLKGGDPFVFARGYEEIKLLVKHGIDFEIVPGISAYSAATTYAGIPLTTRQMARSFAVVTGHYHQSHLAEQQDVNLNIKQNRFSPIVNNADTVIYLMAIKNLQAIVQANLDYGKSAQMGIAIVEKGCTAQQKVYTSTLGCILTEIEEQNLTFSSPGILIVGDIVNCRKIAQWFDHKPLFAKRVLLFKHQRELPKLISLLRHNGADIVTQPLLKSFPQKKEELTQYVQKNKINLCERLKSKQFKILLFTSPKSIDYFFNILSLQGGDSRWIADHKILVVGEGTHATLKQYNLLADYIAEEPNQEGVWQTILASSLNDILFLRAKQIRGFLEEQFIRHNLRFQSIVLYEMLKIKQQIKLVDEDILLFTSSLVVENFFENLNQLTKEEQLNIKTKSLKIICLGPATYRTLLKYDFFQKSTKIQMLLAAEPRFEQLIETCKQVVSR